MNDTLSSDSTEQRVRETLSIVAGAVTEEAFPIAGRPTVARKSHRRRQTAIGAGVLVVPLALAAYAVVREGSEYVDTIPPERIVMSGSVDGSRYLLIETDRTDECGDPRTGVELIEEDENLLGSEWNTSGYEYGEYVERDCGSVNESSRYLENPALFNDSGVEVGDSIVWVYAVHPDVDTVRITSGDYSENLTVYEVDGAGYALFEIPKDISRYTSALLIGGQVVPGSEEEQRVQRP